MRIGMKRMFCIVYCLLLTHLDMLSSPTALHLWLWEKGPPPESLSVGARQKHTSRGQDSRDRPVESNHLVNDKWDWERGRSYGALCCIVLHLIMPFRIVRCQISTCYKLLRCFLCSMQLRRRRNRRHDFYSPNHLVSLPHVLPTVAYEPSLHSTNICDSEKEFFLELPPPFSFSALLFSIPLVRINGADSLFSSTDPCSSPVPSTSVTVTKGGKFRCSLR